LRFNRKFINFFGVLGRDRFAVKLPQLWSNIAYLNILVSISKVVSIARSLVASHVLAKQASIYCLKLDKLPNCCRRLIWVYPCTKLGELWSSAFREQVINGSYIVLIPRLVLK